VGVGEGVWEAVGVGEGVSATTVAVLLGSIIGMSVCTGEVGDITLVGSTVGVVSVRIGVVGGSVAVTSTVGVISGVAVISVVGARVTEGESVSTGKLSTGVSPGSGVRSWSLGGRSRLNTSGGLLKAFEAALTGRIELGITMAKMTRKLMDFSKTARSAQSWRPQPRDEIRIPHIAAPLLGMKMMAK
jgi:hypothetical protein